MAKLFILLVNLNRINKEVETHFQECTSGPLLGAEKASVLTENN